MSSRLDSIGAYRVIEKLGEGGMGEVYRERDSKLNRDVAIKVLPDSFAADPDRLMRFEREAKAMAALSHPNIPLAKIGVEIPEEPAKKKRPSQGFLKVITF